MSLITVSVLNVCRPPPSCLAEASALSACLSNSAAAQVGVVDAGDREAGGGSHEDDFAVSAERSLEGLHDLVDDQMRVLPGVLDEHRELITAESRDGVTATHAAEQSLRGLHQQRVTGGVAQVVVDQFEVVDIHRQDRDRTLVAVIERDRVIKPIMEQDPVGQVGQRVA